MFVRLPDVRDRFITWRGPSSLCEGTELRGLTLTSSTHQDLYFLCLLSVTCSVMYCRQYRSPVLLTNANVWFNQVAGCGGSKKFADYKTQYTFSFLDSLFNACCGSTVNATKSNVRICILFKQTTLLPF